MTHASKCYFSLVLETESPKFRCWHLVPLESSLLGMQMATFLLYTWLFHCMHESLLSFPLFTWTLVILEQCTTLMTPLTLTISLNSTNLNYIFKFLSPNKIMLRVKPQHTNLWRDKIMSTAISKYKQQ